MEQTDGVEIKHARNRLEYRPPKLPHASMDGYFAEPNRDYKYYECHWHGHACQPFRDVTTTNGDNVEARYEQTISRLEQITRAGYQVKVHWKCEFHNAAKETPELLDHPAVCQSPLCTWDDLYGGRTEVMRLNN